MKKIISMLSSVAVVASMIVVPLSVGAETLPGTLSAQDFGVVNYNTGVTGQLKGYTAGFGLTGATFTGATSVVVKLYSGPSGSHLMQTNTAILPRFNADIHGTQFSSPFDVSGTFNYGTDGYWTNHRETQYGQSVPATRVVATVTLAGGQVVTATNTSLVGNPATIYPATIPVVPAPTLLSPADNSTLTTATWLKADWADVTNSVGGIKYIYQSSNSIDVNSEGSFVSPQYTSGALSVSEIPTLSTPAGVWYWHVKAKANGNLSAWSSIWKVTVANTPTPPEQTTPTNMDQCKNNGWKNFNNPSFKNQGQCVSFTNNNDKAAKAAVKAAAKTTRDTALVAARDNRNSALATARTTRDGIIKSAIIGRNSATDEARSVRSESLAAAVIDRNAETKEARLIPDKTERQAALKDAADTYKEASKNARDSYNATVKIARDAYKVVDKTARDNYKTEVAGINSEYSAEVKSVQDAYRLAIK